MRVRIFITAAVLAAASATVSIGLAQDSFKWDRTKKVTPKVGDKYHEWGTSDYERYREVLCEVDTDSGAFFDRDAVDGPKSEKLPVEWHFIREVKAVENGEA